MTAGVIADSIVNLCGAIGLGVAMAALYRRDPKSPLTSRLLFMLGVAAVLFFVRGLAWWSESAWVDRLSLIPAALVPLGALIVTEGMLRRHAPRAVKMSAVSGSCLASAARSGSASLQRLISSRWRCSSSRDLRPAHGSWRGATRPRCWHRKTAASAALPPARCS
jgi:hypothetical protein